MPAPLLVWLRQDLRVHDQPALLAAAAEGVVIPVYVLDDLSPGDWAIGGAQRWWLHHSLAALSRSLEEAGSRLILRRGESVSTLRALLAETGAERVHAIRNYEPWWREAEAKLGNVLTLHDGNHLAPLEEVTTGSGTQFRVYSPFWRALSKHLPPDQPRDAPEKLPAPEAWPASDDLTDWELLPTKPDWARGFAAAWEPGEAAARVAVERFAKVAADYQERRNLPAVAGTSALSPHLHFGEISPAQVWHALEAGSEGLTKFAKELAWRDFTASLTMALPDYAERHGREKYDALEWRTGPEADADLEAWQRGCTGYPIVDAGMRQMWAIGWMHNRVRMIAASFLVKHLLIDWRAGERWFWDCLIDADYGNNSVNWQWIAGTGTDANMFSRIMAPLSQSVKFEAGGYIRRWVPELAGSSDAVIHDPEEAGCLPDGYPPKIIGHREGRERALAANRALR